MGAIYMLTFSNGKAYIGLTSGTVEKRYKEHKIASGYRDDGLIHKAWKKYGAPTLSTLAIVEDYDLAETEIRAIAVYNTLHPNGYNLHFGGHTSPTKNPVVAAKSAASNKGKVIPPEVRAKMSAAKKGVPRSEEAKKAVSAGGKGKKLSEETKAKLRAVALSQNRTPSREAIEKGVAARQAKAKYARKKKRGPKAPCSRPGKLPILSLS